MFFTFVEFCILGYEEKKIAERWQIVGAVNAGMKQKDAADQHGCTRSAPVDCFKSGV